MRSDLTKEVLHELYIVQQLNPYEIAERLGCNHKTVRNKLKAFSIPLRGASEYNFISRRTHTPPNAELLHSPLSWAGHTAYLCEGHHTEKAATFYFCNTETVLVDLMLRFLREVYQVTNLRLVVMAKSIDDAATLLEYYPMAKFQSDPGRVTPLVRLFAGGKMLVRDVVQNAYTLLESQR